ncbi:metallophosphoesterase family protein [Enterovirga sp.]|uniref:metallophosphoesterase family protein n=1 Tax=Enterovirga sp. TaxID=2026350 RepID=UPI002639D2EB|nr:metallophosphoesterase family protein [Enterovirga sp.]MDB5589777.1 serine/threonine protein phosphatase [Enterovirga sp.]
MLTFAIGDVHGCLDLLVDLLGQIEREAAGGPRRVVLLGDLIDRGPDSAGVIRLVRSRQAEDPDSLICLKGNHEDLLLRAARTEATAALWLANGGAETLASFGAAGPEGIPADVVAWIASCPTVYEDAWRCFVHAGLNPAVGRSEQTDADRLWIRDVFLRSDHDFGRYVVHGHTPVRSGSPDVRPTRVNIDTGACFGGPLTAAVFREGAPSPAGFLQARARLG